MKYRLGTRKSALAQVQSRFIQSELQKKGIESELVFIESQADSDRKTPLYAMPTVTGGLFTKELENALLAGEIDFAVHSLKDLPTLQPAGLIVAAIPAREDARDVLVVGAGRSSAWPLPGGTRVGTSSLRREALILSQCPDAEVAPLRGNVPTRLEAVRKGQFDAIIIAAAGLNRLNLDLAGLRRIELDEKLFVPAPGQGALAIEKRQGDLPDLEKAIRQLHNDKAAEETRVERRVLRELEGGCSLPLGVRCRRINDTLEIRAFLGDLAEPKDSVHRWTGFHYFDISEPDEEAAIAKVVRHFRGLPRGAS